MCEQASEALDSTILRLDNRRAGKQQRVLSIRLCHKKRNCLSVVQTTGELETKKGTKYCLLQQGDRVTGKHSKIKARQIDEGIRTYPIPGRRPQKTPTDPCPLRPSATLLVLNQDPDKAFPEGGLTTAGGYLSLVVFIIIEYEPRS